MSQPAPKSEMGIGGNAMPDNAVRVRDATLTDIDTIQKIYAHFVLTGLASFEVDAPDVAEMTRRFEATKAARYPYLVAEIGGFVGGYAYAGPYRARPAYRYTVEDSVYVAPDFHGQGLGRALLSTLIDTCTSMGYRQMVAVIGDSANHPSITLHSRCGFDRAGLLPSTGYKMNRWVDSVIMQRPLGDGDQTPPGT